MSPEELWNRTQNALENGDFTLLDELLTAEKASIIDVLEANGAPAEAMNEAFAWACFTGRTADAERLLDKGVDPAASDKTGLAGFHWAANRGNVKTVRMLIRRGSPLEQVNMYGGTVLGQTLWSAVHEHREGLAEIIELLIDAGAEIESGTLEWWIGQEVPSVETKARVLRALQTA
jgi:ankyrin repeat protein